MGIEIRLHPDVERVVEAVLEDYEMGYDELTSATKARGPLEARYVICALVWELYPQLPKTAAPWSLKRETGQVYAGAARVLKQAQTHPSLAARLTRLRQKLTAAPQEAANG